MATSLAYQRHECEELGERPPLALRLSRSVARWPLPRVRPAAACCCVVPASPCLLPRVGSSMQKALFAFAVPARANILNLQLFSSPHIPLFNHDTVFQLGYGRPDLSAFRVQGRSNRTRRRQNKFKIKIREVFLPKTPSIQWAPERSMSA